MAAVTPLQILLVEDDPGMAVLAADRLAAVEGWSVDGVMTAAECRARMAERRFDVILLDRGLPDCDGAALIGELRALQPEIAIVMLTGADSAASATETLKLGAWDYVVKRPDLAYLDELPAVIRRCAQRIAWQREEARLRSELELLSTAVRTAADAVIMVDGNRIVRFWNAAAERLLGWRADEVLDQPWPLVPRDREAELADLAERAAQGQPHVGVETVLQHRDGSRVDVSLTLTAVRNADGSLRAFVGVVRDISERKALDRARRDFAAMLTHDIKNPLTVIRGFASLLAEADMDPEQVEYIASIDHAGEMIEQLVNDFLMSATIEAGTLKLARERVPVAEFLHRCVHQFQAAATKKRVTLVQGDDGGAAFVHGDRLKLERALGNLIGNAIKFTPAGGTITVDAVCQNGAVLLRVRDTGPGISAEDLPRVFDKYRRVKGSEQIDGTGLGLFIVRSLTEAHGGTVAASSTPGQGSLFTISLPLELAEAA